MTHVGRNDPCPCGSGKKYKRCCLAKGQERDRDLGRRHRALDRAVEWVLSRHRLAAAEAMLYGFLDSLSGEARERVDELPPDYREMLWNNAHEWLLAEGILEIEGRRERVSDLVLGAGGPLFDARERRWIEGMARHPLALWEVQEIRPGEGLWVSDALEPEAPRRWVVERLGSESLTRWDVFGGRLVLWDDHWEITGAVFPFNRDRLPALRSAIAESMESAGDAAERGTSGGAVAEAIIASWLDMLTAPPPLIRTFDAGSGDPILLVTDHYDVHDWARLAAALEAEPDVDGDRQHDWVRFEDVNEEMRRSLLAINPGPGDRLETFARTRRRADEGREWFARVAGDSVTFRTREIVDPATAALERGGSSKQRRPPEIPKTAELTRAMYRQVYRDWADQPIPALGDETPRDAVRTDAGRKRVVELLKSYENHEEHDAREDRREPVSLAFLWEAIGLDRDALLG